MNTGEIRIQVDSTNPGQFFACCGLLELADRMISPSEGWFDGSLFCIRTRISLPNLLSAAKGIVIDYEAKDDDGEVDEDEKSGDDDEDELIVPITISSPILLRLDWWSDKSLKTWAGSMKVELIFLAMCRAIDIDCSEPWLQSQIVYNPPASCSANERKSKKPKKREPFYFDSDRGANAHSLDIGFSPNALKVATLAKPAVEAFCLIGLQRCRPVPLPGSRHFRYSTWSKPLTPELLPVAISGLVDYGGVRHRFVNAFRSSQKKHKAFTAATQYHTEL